MNAERLLVHYESIADAPDAIARLRQFVLNLAIRGKLVAQDPNDEPASELLKSIFAKRRKLAEKGAVRPAKELAASSSEKLFDLPRGWAWTNANQIWDFENGDRSKNYPSKDQLVPEGIPFINAGHLEGGLVSMRGMNFISPAKFRQLGGGKLRRGDQLYCLRGSLGKHAIYLHEGDAAIASSLVILRPIERRAVPYLAKYLDSDAALTMLRRFDNGTAQPNLSSANLRLFEIPLPPLAEQHRIVAKVDELMALCDRLEAARAQCEATRDRLTATSLARLNAPDPETFHNDAIFAIDALPALAARSDQITQLRQTILNLAVRGKLVPQDPSDEPISITLRQAIARRAALVRAKKIRQKKLDDYGELATNSGLPASWTAERLGNLVDPENTISYGVLVPGEEVPDGVPFVRAQDLTLSSHPDRPNKTISPEIEKVYARTRLRGGEILVCVVGSIGKLGTVPQSWAGANIARAVARILPIPEISREYLLVVLRGEPVQTYFAETTRTLAQPTLNVGLIEQTPIPLPPLAEQHRIVAKVDELMALCDRLQASLATAADTRRRLFDALLAEAFAPNEEGESEAAQ